MLSGLINRAKQSASRTARKTALGGAAGLCLAVGTGFFTAAAWLYLITVTTALNATLILGGAYMGIGFILIACMSMVGDKVPQKSTEQDTSLVPDADFSKLMAAFMTGLTAGRRSRS
ncbi:hypothetical protein Z946_1801 [Sulfitobacter noctilucicola]|uniref:Holin-X, holin superfamily III n=1 Tax=Sulfitobacter noctilucicola TaxID=1342301 RepID=A0A7W6M4Z2_9RHOB|nr:phage holin family protein [Sulfitobacter noctilucicola]KIN62938.1 hypothetical protein Z946_1801 [Sulfitobacter noctilucicola]MBB4172534.1 hypothetical protein [Sulfitobacter noctilucicola]